MAVVRPHRLEPPRATGSRDRAPRLSRAALGLVARVGLAAVLLTSISIGEASRPRPAEASVAPRCVIADTTTRFHARSDWYRTLLDTKLRVSRSYAPVDLVAVGRAGVSGRGSVRRIALTDLTAMFRAARAAGATFAVQSAYRSYATQVATFNRWVMEEGYASAIRGSARPGHSEHQLGTVLDLKTPGGPEPWDVADWAQTRAGSWIQRNSWRYGWIVSYPKAKSPSATCYRYEPWHVRYFGRIIAAKIHKSGLAAREWLYVKGATGTWIGGGATATPRPSPTVAPSPTPSVTPSESPSDGPGGSPSDSPVPPPPDPTPDPATPSPTASSAPSPSSTPEPIPTPTVVPEG